VTPAYFCMDNAFPDDLADAILTLALASQGEFVHTSTFGSEVNQGRSFRRSLMLPNALGPLQRQFEQHQRDLFARMCQACGMAPFVISELDIEFVAHRNGHFYRPHLDIRFGPGIDKADTARTLSAVYYVHRQPPGFSGGQLRLLNLDGSDEVVEARHNRLVAFPSILPHEVLPIAVPGDNWDDARFSVNCWFLQ
jgi:SM-20-related protein